MTLRIETRKVKMRRKILIKENRRKKKKRRNFLKSNKRSTFLMTLYFLKNQKMLERKTSELIHLIKTKVLIRTSF
jgi:hypothetical protein